MAGYGAETRGWMGEMQREFGDARADRGDDPDRDGDPAGGLAYFWRGSLYGRVDGVFLLRRLGIVILEARVATPAISINGSPVRTPKAAARSWETFGVMAFGVHVSVMMWAASAAI
jgi:hypothetical protein